jgi:hypothetical protein
MARFCSAAYSLMGRDTEATFLEVKTRNDCVALVSNFVPFVNRKRERIFLDKKSARLWRTRFERMGVLSPRYSLGGRKRACRGRDDRRSCAWNFGRIIRAGGSPCRLRLDPEFVA